MLCSKYCTGIRIRLHNAIKNEKPSNSEQKIIMLVIRT